MTVDDNNIVEILIVDDNFLDADLTIRALKDSQLANNIVHLIDGAEALDFIFGKGDYEGRNTKQLPKVIFLDLKMPKISGLEVLEVLKQENLTKKIPIVVLTSSAEDPDIEKAYELGANSYVVKPVDFDNFSNTIKDLGLYWIVVNKV